MSPLLNKKISQAACIVAVLSSFSATATLIAGFINMGTYHVADLESSVGIWCGMILFICVFTGLLMIGTRHIHAASVYLLSNLVSLGISIYGIIKSVEYYNDFVEFREYNDHNLCTLGSNNVCQCRNGEVFRTGNDYTLEHCSLFAFGEELWLGIIILIATCILWSFVGFVIGLGGVFIELVSQDDEGSNRPPSIQYRSMSKPIATQDMRIM